MSEAIELSPQAPNRAVDLILPHGIRPSNLHLPQGAKVEYIDSDVLGICEQLREISPHLYIVVMHQGEDAAWVIMEDCTDGEQRMVFKVNELDGRVLDRLRKIMALPLKDRIRKIEHDQAKAAEARKEERKDKAVEELALPMYRQLHQDGFLQRPVSYPKTGVTGGKGSLGKS